MGITNIDGGLIGLNIADFSQPIMLVFNAVGNGYLIQTFGTQYQPWVEIRDTSGKVLKHYAQGSSISVDDDIRPVINGLKVIQVVYSIGGGNASGVNYGGTLGAAFIQYTDLPISENNPQTLTLDAGTAPFSDTVDFTVWDGITPIILDCTIFCSDGETDLLINGIQVSDTNDSPAGGNGPSLKIHKDISPYVKRGPNTISLNFNSHHGWSTSQGSISQMIFSFNALAPIPIITFNPSVENHEVKDYQGITSNLSGEISIYADKPTPIVLDTKGITTPSLITINDPTVATKASVQLNQSGDLQDLSVDIYLLVNGQKYIFKTIRFKADVTITDVSPAISFIGFQNYVQVAGTDFIGTVRCTFEIDNSKYAKPISAKVGLNYFGETDETFQVPANGILIAAIDHGYTGSISAVKETGGGASIIIGQVAKSAMFDTPSLGLIQSLPPALPRPTVTVIPSSPGSTSGPGTTTPGTNQAIVLTKGEKIFLAGGVITGVVVILLAAAFGKNDHKSKTS